MTLSGSQRGSNDVSVYLMMLAIHITAVFMISCTYVNIECKNMVKLIYKLCRYYVAKNAKIVVVACVKRFCDMSIKQYVRAIKMNTA